MLSNSDDHQNFYAGGDARSALFAEFIAFSKVFDDDYKLNFP